MSKNTKIRGLVWLLLAFVVVFAVGSASYVGQATNLDVRQIFEGKTETQIGLEFMEIFSTYYEERPVISETRTDYSFSVHRIIQNRNSVNTDLYVYFRNLDLIEENGVQKPSVGFLDAFVYCSSEDNPYFREISNVDLRQITGTSVFAGFLSMPREFITRCESNEFLFVVDTPIILQPGEAIPSADEREFLEVVSLSDIYNLQEVSTAAALQNAVVLNAGFGGDINTSTYSTFSVQRALINAALSTPIVIPLAYGLWYATEKEIFNESVSLKQLKTKPKKKSGK